MKGLQIDIRGKIMNCVTPKGQVCVFVEADNMVVLGEDKENSVKLDWGKIELAVGDKVKITAIEGMEYDTIYMSSMTDEDMLGYYNQLKKFLTKEGVEMRGFRIKFRSEEIVVTPDFRSSVTIFYSSSNGYELSVAGIKGFGDDALDTFWIKSDMHIGESIEIEIINADEQVCSSPTCVKKLDPNPLKLSEKQKQQMLDEYLKDFYLLEAQLKKKGVL